MRKTYLTRIQSYWTSQLTVWHIPGVCVYVCAFMDVHVCVYVCSRALDIAQGLCMLVEVSSGPGGGWEQRKEERGASIWSQSVWCKLPRCIACNARCKHSSPALTCFVGGSLVKRKIPAGWSLPLLLTVSFSLYSQNSMQTTWNSVYNFTGFGLLRDSPEFCYLFRFPDRMYNPGIGVDDQIKKS